LHLSLRDENSGAAAIARAHRPNRSAHRGITRDDRWFWKSPRGKIAIDPATRDIINTVYIKRVEKLNGEIRNVEIAKFENVKDPVKARMK
jgi:hypothetical protein